MRLLLLVLPFLLAGCATPAPRSSSDAPFDNASLGEVAGDRAVAARADARGQEAAERRLVRTAALAVEVDGDDRVEPALDRARALTESLDGYVSWEGPGEMVLRIPDASLEAAMDQLSALGEVERREVRVQDVTASYTDLEIRLSNARALQSRLRDLLSQAQTVADVLAVETELARVTAQVEGLEGQLRLLHNQVAFSTLRLSVSDGVTPGPLGWVFVGAYEAVKWLFVWD